MGTHADIAQAVVTTLDGESFTQDFTATRTYQDVRALSDLDALAVFVKPRSWTFSGLSRGGAAEEDFQVDVVIRKRVDDLDVDTLDPLAGLAEEIVDLLHGNPLDGVTPHATCIASEMDDPFLDEHLDELRTFTATLTLTYRVVN